MLYVLARESHGGTAEEFDLALEGLSSDAAAAFVKAFQGRLNAVG